MEYRPTLVLAPWLLLSHLLSSTASRNRQQPLSQTQKLVTLWTFGWAASSWLLLARFYIMPWCTSYLKSMAKDTPTNTSIMTLVQSRTRKNPSRNRMRGQIAASSSWLSLQASLRPNCWHSLPILTDEPDCKSDDWRYSEISENRNLKQV